MRSTDPAITLKRIGNNGETYLIGWKMIAILPGEQLGRDISRKT